MKLIIAILKVRVYHCFSKQHVWKYMEVFNVLDWESVWTAFIL